MDTRLAVRVAKAVGWLVCIAFASCWKIPFDTHPVRGQRNLFRALHMHEWLGANTHMIYPTYMNGMAT